MTSASIELRLATAKDLPAIQAVLVQTWHELYEALEREAKLSLRYHAPPPLADELEDPSWQLLVAEVDREIVASASGAQRGDGTYLIERIYVLPSAQGLGVGARLFDRLVEHAGSRPIQVEVDARNRRGLAFYARCGFEIIGERERGDEPTGAIRYLVLQRGAAL